MKSNVVSDYVKRVSDDNLFELRTKFYQDLQGDKAVVCEILSKDREMDKWLSKAINAEDFFAMVDQIEEAVIKECARRESAQEFKRRK
jgi:Leu/Phe-tRNA-protein transferase